MPFIPITEKKNKNSKQENGWIPVNDEIIRSANFLLKSAIQLSEANEGKLVLIDENGKKNILGFSNSPVSEIEKQYIDRAIKENVPFNIPRENNKPGPFLIIPLSLTNTSACGAICLKEKKHASNFPDEDLALIKNLSTHFTSAYKFTRDKIDGDTLLISFSKTIEMLTLNMGLLKDNLENRKLITEILHVSKLINSTIDLHNLLESIMQSAKLVLRTEGSSLMLIDESTQELYFNIVTGEKEKELKEVRIPIGKGIAGIVARDKKPEIVNDAQNDDRVYKEADQKAGFLTRNLLAAPLMVRDKIIGVLEVINTIGRDDFSKEELELFITFSEQAAIAIHNRELINSLKKTNEDLRKKLHELSSLHEVSKVLISSGEEKALFDSIVKIISVELKANRVSIMIHREKTDKLELVSRHGSFEDGQQDIGALLETLSGTCFQENRMITTQDLQNSELSHFRNEKRYKSAKCLLYPLSSGNKRFGVLNISGREDDSDFGTNEIQLVSTIAGQITKAIENFRLLEETIEKKSFEKELEITSSMQKAILPSISISHSSFKLGFISRPAKIMGGDFYDFESLSENEFTFLIADVSGKSLPAALFMAVTSSIVRTLNQSKLAPAQLLYRANDMIYKNSQSGMFVTLFLTSLNTTTRELKFSSAGHNEQFVYRGSEGKFIFLEAKGGPLGVINSSLHGEFTEGSMILQEGDLVVLYTDGIVEAINSKEEEFGLDRFQELIKKLAEYDPQEIVDRVYKEVNRFAGEEPQFDDFTLLIIKF